MDRDKDLSAVLLSDLCGKRSVKVQTALGRELTYIQSWKKLIVVKKEVRVLSGETNTNLK